MADLNTTIDRAGTISRQVSSLLDRRMRNASARYAKCMQVAARDLLAGIAAHHRLNERQQAAVKRGGRRTRRTGKAG
jgi:hypothetical protein